MNYLSTWKVKKMKKMENDLSKLNIYNETYTTINGVDIPIYIHIRDITPFTKEHQHHFTLDIIGNDMRIDETISPFKEYYDKYKQKKKIRYYLQFIDNRPIFEGKTWLEHMLSEEYEGDILLDMDKLGLSYQMYIKLINEINAYIQNIQAKCLDVIKEMIDYDREFPNIKLKKKSGMQKYSEYLNYSQAMSILQSNMEYTNSIIFPENIDKAFMEYSFREIYLKVMYISFKNKIEGMSNKIQNKLMERDD